MAFYNFTRLGHNNPIVVTPFDPSKDNVYDQGRYGKINKKPQKGIVFLKTASDYYVGFCTQFHFDKVAEPV